MKKLVSALTALIIFFSTYNINAYAKEQNVNIRAKEAILVDMSTGKFMYKQNSNQKIMPGGFTKIMTAIIAIENMLDLNEAVTADANVINSYDYSFGNMGILAGETLTVGDLLYGMLLYDAGDAAEVIASYSLNDRKKFIKKMNEKAVELGALNTKFTNPTGYPDENQYTTLEDTYKIVSYALQNETFAKIVNTGMYEIAPTNKYLQKRYLANSNKFITRYTSDRYYTACAKGVKTSYINDNKCGLVLWYETEDINLLTLVADSPYDGVYNYAYEDTVALIRHGKNYFEKVKVLSKGDILAEIGLNNGKGVDRILLEAQDDVYINLPKGYDEKKISIDTSLEKKVKAPIILGQALGVVKVKYKGEEYAKIVLTSPQSVEASHIKGFFRFIWGIISSPQLLITLGILLIIFVWSTLIYNTRKQKKQKAKKYKM